MALLATSNTIGLSLQRSGVLLGCTTVFSAHLQGCSFFAVTVKTSARSPTSSATSPDLPRRRGWQRHVDLLDKAAVLDQICRLCLRELGLLACALDPVDGLPIAAAADHGRRALQVGETQGHALGHAVEGQGFTASNMCQPLVLGTEPRMLEESIAPGLTITHEEHFDPTAFGVPFNASISVAESRILRQAGAHFLFWNTCFCSMG